MANRDLVSALKPAIALNFAARSAATTVNGNDIDRAGFESIAFYGEYGTWTDGTHTFKIQEADDNGSGAPGTYSDVAAGDQKGSFTAISGAGGSNTLQEVGYQGIKRWVRLCVTTSGATTGAVSGGTVVRGNARSMPA